MEKQHSIAHEVHVGATTNGTEHADGRGQPGRSRLLPSGSGGESAREDAGVAPFIGTSGQSLLRIRKAEVIRLREPRVSIYVAGRFPFSVG